MKRTTRFIKKLIKSKIGQSRKKGAVLVEFIMSIPVFFLILWGAVNMLTYLLASYQLGTAADDVARSLAVEMRGVEGQIDPNIHTQNVWTQIQQTTGNNYFIGFAKLGNGKPVEAYDEASCDGLWAADERNILCAYVKVIPTASGKTQEKIIVRMRSDFNPIGELIGGFQKFVHLNAKAVVQKELTDRYNYVD